jgi:3-hydroxyisobutyrate dehydrogenase
MSVIGFIGLGNMGGPMAANLVKAGHDVRGFDLSEASLKTFSDAGGTVVASAAEAASDAEIVVTMLPAGQHVRSVYMDDGGLIATCKPGTLMIDCSTIDVPTARDVISAAEAAGHMMLDAPVSGGVAGAAAGTLTFMCGGSADAFEKARPYLDVMGKNVFHAGGPGNGQAAKVCNNMLLGISMIGTAEAFNLAAGAGAGCADLL